MTTKQYQAFMQHLETYALPGYLFRGKNNVKEILTSMLGEAGLESLAQTYYEEQKTVNVNGTTGEVPSFDNFDLLMTSAATENNSRYLTELFAPVTNDQSSPVAVNQNDLTGLLTSLAELEARRKEMMAFYNKEAKLEGFCTRPKGVL